MKSRKNNYEIFLKRVSLFILAVFILLLTFAFALNITFQGDTPTDGSNQIATSIIVNLSASDLVSYSFVDFNRDLILWMRMDDANASTVFDLSTYSYNGTFVGKTAVNFTGYWGNGSAYDGTGDYIQLSSAITNLSNNTHSLSAWVNSREYSQSINMLFSSAVSGSTDERLNVYATTTGAIAVFDDYSLTFNTGATTIPVNEWHHVAVVYDYPSQSSIIYLDGISIVTDSSFVQAPSTIGATKMKIGARQSNANVFNGTIDEVILWERALTSAEVLALYNATSNQYYRNFTGLSVGTYNFTGYIVNSTASINETSRTVTITDATPPEDVHLQNPPYNLYSAWNFNRDTGTTAWSYDKLDNGVYNGNVAMAVGKYGNATKFDGTGDFINVTSSYVKNFSGQAISVSFWVNHTLGVAFNNDYLFGNRKSSVTTGGLGVYLFGNTNPYAVSIAIGDEEGEECLASTSTTLSKNNWTHVAFVFNGTDTTPYINGVQGTRDNCGDVVDFGFVMGISSNDFLIGDGYDGVDFNGQLDEIMLFNKTLTQEEITEIYQVQNKDIIRFVHLTDTHIITGGSSNPIFMDGRTDTFGYFDEYPQYGIWNNTNNISTAPTRAFQDAVKLASAYFPLYVFHTGDISSSGGGLGGSHDTNCDGNLSSAQNLSRDILNNLTLVDKWYTVSANYHDAVTNETCLKIYTDAFGSDMIQWNFTNGNNIFVGSSELNDDVSNKYNITHINDTIKSYIGGNNNLFVFVHQPPNTYRATEDTQLINLLEDNTARFNTTQVYGGHGHSNDYSFNNSVHYIQTTAVMNYPTEFRIVDINGTASHAYNSTIINQNISDFSLFILNNAIISKAENTTLYGNESERNLMLNFQIASPVAALVTGETTSGTSFILRDSEANLSLSDLFDFSVSKRGKWFLEKENVLIVETYDYNLNFV